MTPSPHRVARKKEEVYCIACGFPQSPAAMIKFFRKEGLNGLAKALERLSASSITKKGKKKKK